MAKKNLIVGQSGGPTAVINSSLYGVVSEGLSHPDTIEHVYGMINGIEGFLNDCILDFEEALPGEDLNLSLIHIYAFLFFNSFFNIRAVFFKIVFIYLFP